MKQVPITLLLIRGNYFNIKVGLFGINYQATTCYVCNLKFITAVTFFSQPLNFMKSETCKKPILNVKFLILRISSNLQSISRSIRIAMWFCLSIRAWLFSIGQSQTLGSPTRQTQRLVGYLHYLPCDTTYKLKNLEI